MLKRLFLALSILLATPAAMVLVAAPAYAQTATQALRFVTGAGQPVANATVKIYAHGASQIPANVLASGTTDVDGYLSPQPSLTPGTQYDFTTTDPRVPSGTFTAQNATQLNLIPGPTGPQGPSGPPGPAGTVASTTTSNVTMPAVNSTVSVPVANAGPFPYGAYVVIASASDSFLGQVTSTGATSPLTVKNLAINFGTAGDSIPSGSNIAPAGAQGPAGATGPAGPNGQSSTTTSVAFTVPAVGSSVSVSVLSATAYPLGTYITIADTTDSIIGKVTSSGGTSPLTVLVDAITYGTAGDTIPVGSTVTFGPQPVNITASSPIVFNSSNQTVSCPTCVTGSGSNNFSGALSLNATGTATSSTTYGSYALQFYNSLWSGSAAVSNTWSWLADNSGNLIAQYNGTTKWTLGNDGHVKAAWFNTGNINGIGQYNAGSLNTSINALSWGCTASATQPCSLGSSTQTVSSVTGTVAEFYINGSTNLWTLDASGNVGAKGTLNSAGATILPSGTATSGSQHIASNNLTLQSSDWNGSTAVTNNGTIYYQNGTFFFNPATSNLSVGSVTSTGSTTIGPAGTATSGTNYGSAGGFQLQNSIWSGSAAVTHTWGLTADNTGKLSFQLDGATNSTLDTSGNFATSSLTLFPSAISGSSGSALVQYNSGVGGTAIWSGANVIAEADALNTYTRAPSASGVIYFGNSLSSSAYGSIGTSGASINGYVAATSALNADSGNANGLGLQIDGANVVYSDGGGSNSNLFVSAANAGNIYFGYQGHPTAYATLGGGGFALGSVTSAAIDAGTQTLLSTDGTYTYLRDPNQTGTGGAIQFGNQSNGLEYGQVNVNGYVDGSSVYGPTSASVNGLVNSNTTTGGFQINGHNVVIADPSGNVYIASDASGGVVYLRNYALTQNNIGFPDTGGIIVYNGQVNIQDLGASASVCTDAGKNLTTTGCSAIASSQTITPAGTATSGTNYGSSGGFQLENSLWNGTAAVTHTWQWAADSAGNLLSEYDGATQVWFSSAGNLTASGTIDSTVAASTADAFMLANFTSGTTGIFTTSSILSGVSGTAFAIAQNGGSNLLMLDNSGDVGIGGSFESNGDIKIPAAGTATSGTNYGSVGAFDMQSSQWSGSAAVMHHTKVIAGSTGDWQFVYDGTPRVWISSSGAIATSSGINLQGDDTSGGQGNSEVWIAKDGATTLGMNFNVPTGSTYGWRFLVAGASVVAQIDAAGKGWFSQLNDSGLAANATYVCTDASRNFTTTGCGSAIASSQTITPAGTATSGTNYGSSGGFQLENSLWNGTSAATHTWQWAADNAGNLIAQYDGATQATISNAGKISAASANLSGLTANSCLGTDASKNIVSNSNCSTGTSSGATVIYNAAGSSYSNSRVLADVVHLKLSTSSCSNYSNCTPVCVSGNATCSVAGAEVTLTIPSTIFPTNILGCNFTVGNIAEALVPYIAATPTTTSLSFYVYNSSGLSIPASTTFSVYYSCYGN